jgi:hypothetical protein
MLALLLAPSLTLTLDDIAVGVLTGNESITKRILPMSRCWYQLVPEVNIYTDVVPDSIWPEVSSNPRVNLFFHTSTATSHHLVGTEFETGWNTAQSRHFHAIADLYDRYPKKKFYFICDDDTFLLPDNLLRKLNETDPTAPVILGYIFTVIGFAHPFFPNTSVEQPFFAHGGSGIVISAGAMAIVGPHLRNCSDQFEIANLGSDMRLAACLSHRRVNGTFFPNRESFVPLKGLNPHRPDLIEGALPPGLAVTFHHVFAEFAQAMFDRVIEAHGNRYRDWQGIMFQPLYLEIGGHGRRYFMIVGYMICCDWDVGRCKIARGGMTKLDSTLANFTQKVGDYVVYYRCNDSLSDAELAYFGPAPPPDEGIIVEVKCGELKSFVNRNTGWKRLTTEDVTEWMYSETTIKRQSFD